MKIKIKYFLKYLQNNTDDSPLYVFDSRFENDAQSKSLLNEYKVPTKYFPDDLFSLVGEKRRPPYRWFLGANSQLSAASHI